MLESKFQSDLVTSLRNCKAVVIVFSGSRFQQPGIPDIYVSHPIWRGWLELKVNAPIDIKQKQMIQELKRTGDNAFIVKYPNLIMTEDEEILAVYGTTISLLDELRNLSA